MPLTLNNIGKKKRKRKRVGRGNASGHGTYSTRGLKGQRSRSGGKSGLKIKGYKRTLLTIPKFKGQKSKKPKAQVVKLSVLEKNFDNDEKITPGRLLEKRIIDKIDVPAKILFDKEIKKQFAVFGCRLSKTARQALEKAGGKVVEPEDAKESKKVKKQKSIA